MLRVGLSTTGGSGTDGSGPEKPAAKLPGGRQH